MLQKSYEKLFVRSFVNAHESSHEGALERCSTWVCSGLTHQHYTRLERLTKDPTLLETFVNYGHKKYRNIGHSELYD